MDSATTYDTKHPAHGDAHECAPVPEFRRLNFTYGQLLGVADFRTEQSYFREKQRLHNRCLHGYGVVCGLLVHPGVDPLYCPTPDARSEELKERLGPREGADAIVTEQDGTVPAETKGENILPGDFPEREDLRLPPILDPKTMRPTRITIDCGLALDCAGNELVVRRPLTIDLWHALSAEEQKKAASGRYPLYVSLCYCEQPVDPIRPVVADQCGTIADCVFGKLRESVRVHVSLDKPEEDDRCETCCSAHGDCCVLLARIDHFGPGVPADKLVIHNNARRRLSTYPSTVITGINWVHGGEYLPNDVEKILGGDDANSPGLEIHFSRPILVSSLRRGVVELWRIKGGTGQSGDVSEITGEFILGSGKDTTVLRYRKTDDEEINYGDRILIQVRCAFILDRCCRPVDGAHVGGRVPLLASEIKPQSAPHASECTIPPWGYAPWTSGSGSPGSTFESWIIASEKDKKSGPTKTGAVR